MNNYHATNWNSIPLLASLKALRLIVVYHHVGVFGLDKMLNRAFLTGRVAYGRPKFIHL
jgi:hypothetical protein